MGKIKGVAMVPTVKALRHLGARDDETFPQALRPYLVDRVFPSMWYDEDDLMGLLHALIGRLPQRPDAWEWIGTVGAREDFTATYSAFVRAGRPSLTLQRYPAVWKLYHDNGEVSVESSEEGRAEITIQGHLVQYREFCRLQAGHFDCLIQLSGGEDVEVRVLEVADDERPARWLASWR